MRTVNPPLGGFLRFEASKGFTLLELIATITIIGIMAVVILPKWQGNSGFEERAFRDRVIASLRYAQKSAIATRRTTCASFSASPAAVAFRISTNNGAVDCSTGSILVGSDGTQLMVTAASGVAFSPLPANITFDAAGRPVAAASIALSGMPASLNITVEAETGYVY